MDFSGSSDADSHEATAAANGGTDAISSDAGNVTTALDATH